MSPYFLISIGLQIAGALQWGFLTFRVFAHRKRGVASWIFAIFSTCVAGYLLTPLALVVPFSKLFQHFFFVLMFTSPYFLWLTSKALFEDEFRVKPWHVLFGVYALGVDLFTYWPTFLYPYFLESVSQISFLGPVTKILFPQFNTILFVVLALLSVHKDRTLDLNDERSDFRKTFIQLTALAGILIAVGDAYMKTTGQIIQWVNILTASLVYAIGFGMNLMLAKSDSWLFKMVSVRAIPSQNKEIPLTLDERARQRFKQLIEIDKIYLNATIDLANLAKALGIPDYRLRRHINQELGFENFNQFLNTYRIAEAKIKLEQDRDKNLPMYNLAIDLGYGSSVSFNRAFKEATGMTPTQYREVRMKD